MKRLVLSLLLLLGLFPFPGPGVAQAQTEAGEPGFTGPITGTRVVDVRPDPTTPSFGEVFQLRVTARLPRRAGISLVDTLGPTNSLRSAGPGRWEESRVAGDSTEIRGTFPVLAFRDGTRELPGLLIRTGQGRSAPGMPEVPERIPLGTVGVRPPAAFGSGSGVAVPRPPADVVGSEWSIWMLLAVAVVLLGVLGLGRTLLSGRGEPADPGTDRPIAGKTGPLGREEALRLLDEIHARGWHRNGRIHDFYQASTDTLRRFVEGRDSSWNESLTSSELLGRARERWGSDRVEELRATVEVAERVKFGGRRPGTREAEQDWETIRAWVEGAP